MTRSGAWRRLEQARPPPWVLAHSLAVEGLAAAMAQQAADQDLEVDADLVREGALLHDIGRSITQDVHHAEVGARILREEGWPRPVVDVVERHTGGGIDEDEARGLGLPVKDYTPRTLEERLVCHADNLFSGSRRLGLDQVRAKYGAKGLDGAAQKIVRLHEELQDLLACDLDALAPLRSPAP